MKSRPHGLWECKAHPKVGNQIGALRLCFWDLRAQAVRNIVRNTVKNGLLKTLDVQLPTQENSMFPSGSPPPPADSLSFFK